MEILFVIVPIFIVGVFCIILFQIGRNVAEWADNNSKPILNAPARVITKRQETHGNVSSNTGGQVSTAYYVTFELEDGQRMEFSLYGKDFGLLAEGDEGTVTYQGTRYHGFQRQRKG